jgi:hypothetical protein
MTFGTPISSEKGLHQETGVSNIMSKGKSLLGGNRKREFEACVFAPFD